MNKTTPETEEWRKEQVSGIWRVYHNWSIRETNEVCKCATEADADQIIRDHNTGLQANKGMALLAGEVADARQEAREAKTAARIAVEALELAHTLARRWYAGPSGPTFPELERLRDDTESALAAISGATEGAHG